MIYRSEYDNIINYSPPGLSIHLQYNLNYRQPHDSNEIINKKLIESENIDVECSICLETCKKSNFVMLDCKHMFDKKCFFSWMKHNKTCPLCRKPCTKVDCFC